MACVWNLASPAVLRGFTAVTHRETATYEEAEFFLSCSLCTAQVQQVSAQATLFRNCGLPSRLFTGQRSISRRRFYLQLLSVSYSEELTDFVLHLCFIHATCPPPLLPQMNISKCFLNLMINVILLSMGQILTGGFDTSGISHLFWCFLAGKRRFQKRLFCNWTGGYKWSTALALR